MNKIKFTRIAGWIAAFIGGGAIFQGFIMGFAWFGFDIQRTIGSVSVSSGGVVSGNQITIWFLGLMLINFGQFFVGARILKGKEGARKAILIYQLVYAVLMEIFNMIMIPNGDFINKYGFLGVLIVPVLISLLVLIGRKEELPSDFRVV